MNITDINIKEYNYDLAEQRIAKHPLLKREDSKLLIYNKGEISQKKFNQIHELTDKGELFVFNNTKVIQARLNFKKITGANIEIFCLEPIEPTDYNLMFQSVNSCKWKCIVGNLKKWKADDIFSSVTINGTVTEITAKKESSSGNSHIIKFSWNNPELTFGEILEQMGQTPIPPYLKRNSEKSDKDRYQTVYSEHKGSVAAPTAGLHFTKDVLSTLTENGIDTEYVTLHVGAGTFKPVQSDSIFDHEMHTEHFFVTKELIEKLISKIGNITSVGTTTVRTLESLYFLGVKLETEPELKYFHIKQWEVYSLNTTISTKDALLNVLNYLKQNNLQHIEASTQIIIVPGYTFKVITKLITNFHQPKSTLLLLIAAFIGNDWKKVYDYALENDFRFLSYGDSSVLMP